MANPRPSARTKLLALWLFPLCCLSLLVAPSSKAQGTIPTGTPSVYLPVIAKPLPMNTPVPTLTVLPTPLPTAEPTYLFNVAIVAKCERQPAGNWFWGTVAIQGQPVNGYKVVFSYASDAVPVTEPILSGPHPGYPGWNTGYYSHIISANGPRAGDWYVWIINDAGQRISEIAHWHSTGPGEGCNQAEVNFDSR